MKRHCEKIRNAIAELGPQALSRDEAAQEHVAGCEECFAFLEAAAQLEAEIAALEPIDAPDELVEQLFERVDAATGLASGGSRRRWSPASSGLRVMQTLGAWWTLRYAVAAGLFIVVMSGLLLLVLPERARMPADGLPSSGLTSEDEPRRALVQAEQAVRFRPPAEPAPVTERGGESAPQPPAAPPARQSVVEVQTVESAGSGGGTAGKRDFGARKDEPEGEQPPPAFDIPPRPAAKAIPDGRLVGGDLDSDETALRDAFLTGEMPSGAEADQLLAEDLYLSRAADKKQAGLLDAVGKETAAAEVGKYLSPIEGFAKGDTPGGEKTRELDESRFETKEKSEEAATRRRADGARSNEEVVITGEAPPIVASGGIASTLVADTDEAARRAARAFLRERELLDGLTFQEASGYWANTYVPGDPLLRLLDARLSLRDRSSFEPFAASAPAPHDASHQAVQPFDPPQDAALGVFLSGDRSALEGEGRMLVQVGLEATARRGGRRSAMNLALVLDLRSPIEGDIAAAMRALVFAFVAAHDVGDRFHLVVAGRPGGVLIGPDDFRHGPLAVALEQVLGAQQPASLSPDRDGRGDVAASVGPVLDLPAALEEAIDAVTAGDDPAAPLGSSAVILVTAQPLAGAAEHLERCAHVSAVAGVPVSVVGVGEGVEREELDRLALAGQGTRRLLTRPADAEALAESELTAASRAVARAVRLRIRLASGVRLVDVLGSRRLDAASADRVREAEQSIDRRLASNLGIAADRGDDEEGIQIVIPTFYAGDSHVVLLDVVAPGPGPLADVTVRFKDLVFLRNGVARTQLSIESGESSRGPLQLNVLQNLLALRLYGALEKAGLSLARGDAQGARDEIVATRALLRGIALELRELGRDRGFQRDLAMLDEYLTLMDADLDAEGAIHLAESLRLAGRLKVLPRPMALGGGR